MAPKNPPAEPASTKAPQTKSQQANKAANNKNASLKKQAKNAAHEQKQPVSKGIVTMTQKQLDAILQTIGQLTTENAELQTKLIYNGENSVLCAVLVIDFTNFDWYAILIDQCDIVLQQGNYNDVLFGLTSEILKQRHARISILITIV